jgi:hypothetical protein
VDEHLVTAVDARVFVGGECQKAQRTYGFVSCGSWIR